MYTRRYSPLRVLNSSSCGGVRPPAEAFWTLRAKEKAFYAVFAYFRPFWCSIVTSVSFSSNLIKKILSQKSPQKIPKIFQKTPKISNNKNTKKFQTLQNNHFLIKKAENLKILFLCQKKRKKNAIISVFYI